jgi:hypothetical protein
MLSNGSPITNIKIIYSTPEQAAAVPSFVKATQRSSPPLSAPSRPHPGVRAGARRERSLTSLQ